VRVLDGAVGPLAVDDAKERREEREPSAAGRLEVCVQDVYSSQVGRYEPRVDRMFDFSAKRVLEGCVDACVSVGSTVQSLVFL
jgi:hypothetical protein